VCRMGNWREWVVFGALLVVVGLLVRANSDSSMTDAGSAIALLGVGLLFGGAFRWASSRSDRGGPSA
jgi:hypothetical protein